MNYFLWVTENLPIWWKWWPITALEQRISK